MNILTPAEIKRAKEEIESFADMRSTDVDAIASAIERATNLMAACEEGEMEGREADTSMYGILAAGVSGVRQRLRNRLTWIEGEV